MRPFTVLIGIVLGSAASFTFGLATVLIVFLVLGPQHPELPRELPRVAGSLAAFAILTAASAGSLARSSRSCRQFNRKKYSSIPNRTAPAQCPMVFTRTGSWILSQSGILV